MSTIRIVWNKSRCHEYYLDCAKITDQSHEYYLECAFFTNQSRVYYLEHLFYSALKSKSESRNCKFWAFLFYLLQQSCIFSSLKLTIEAELGLDSSKYSLLLDCAHGRNRNIDGNFGKTTAWLKATGRKSKNFNPYKNLTCHFWKTTGWIKPTGVRCSAMISEKPQG